MKLKRILGAAILVVVAALLSGYVYLQHPKFGAVANAAVLQQSPHYVDGEFHNLEPDPQPDVVDSDQKGWMDFLLSSSDNRTPPAPVPADSTDLRGLDPDRDVVVWLGHSTFYIQMGGQRVLIDPVLSDNASPVPMTNQAFDGANPFQASDIPDIDYLLISHDHWDHLDYPTIMALADRTDDFVVGLGVGEHLRSWGIDSRRIHEADWETTLELDDRLAIHVLPARHYSGRLMDRNQSLWVSFALQTEEHSLYFSGDSGYGEHLKAIGERFDGFDLALLDSGQYDEAWRHIHMTPEDAAMAADDLKARALMPAHVGKFSIAFHAWDDPFSRIAAASEDRAWGLVTPRIGQPVTIGEGEASTRPWWRTVAGAD